MTEQKILMVQYKDVSRVLGMYAHVFLAARRIARFSPDDWIIYNPGGKTYFQDLRYLTNK